MVLSRIRLQRASDRPFEAALAPGVGSCPLCVQLLANDVPLAPKFTAEGLQMWQFRHVNCYCTGRVCSDRAKWMTTLYHSGWLLTRRSIYLHAFGVCPKVQIPASVSLRRLEAVLEAFDKCFVDSFYSAVGLGVIGGCCQVLNFQTHPHGCKELGDDLWSVGSQ